MARLSTKGVTRRELVLAVLVMAIIAAVVFPIAGRARQRGLNARLLEALKHDQLDVAKRLLSRGADPRAVDPSRSGWTSLHYVAFARAPDAVRRVMVDMLLTYGAHVNARADDGRTPLRIFASRAVRRRLLLHAPAFHRALNRASRPISISSGMPG